MIAATYVSTPNSRLLAYFDQPLTPVQRWVPLGSEGRRERRLSPGAGQGPETYNRLPRTRIRKQKFWEKLVPQGSVYHGERSLCATH